MIQLSDHAEGVLIPVRVQPKAKRPGVQGEQGGMLKVAVSAPPEDGRANAAVVELLAEVMSVRRSQVSVHTGQTARNKMILVRGLPRAQLEQRLAALLAGQ